MMANQQLESLARLTSEDQQASQLTEAQQIFAAANEGISKAQAGIRALQRLVDSQLPEEMKPRSISDIIRRAALTVGTRSFVKTDTSTDATVMAIGSQVEDTIINLIKNAQEAGGEKCQIDVWSKLDPVKRGVTIVISDNGPGIEAAVAPHIFEPSFSTKDRGSGVGLAVSRQIINAHGGQLTLDLSVSQGASFIIWLPLLTSHS